ncbi:hypothetical protein [Curtobacterium sp. MCLR17_034]|uniref:hypothetical protein n=1 Tax=Curtobacterium sp. MCLR17_034 TaxID=2175623 RepID=UPI000DA85027|nr:hypothetical protein [Curtobacterium sp. MCLR17_034]PZF11739.1 hypothetical protein DEI98_06365 [Curtobacterium sp. MCLR17_034]
MEFRAAVATVVDRLNLAITDSTVAPSTIAHAADISVPDLNERLAMRDEFTVAELIAVGGVLRVHPADLIGAAA